MKQELFAYGLGNVVSSFFKGFPSCVGLSRCIILESTGAKTQVNLDLTSELFRKFRFFEKNFRQFFFSIKMK